MSRTMMLGAAAFAALVGGSITVATAQDDITVTGPRSTIIHEPGSTMDTSVLVDSTIVNYADLDLRTMDGRNMLVQRVNRAARQTCNRLDDQNKWNIPLNGPGTDLCMIYAKGLVQPQIDRAVALYGG